MSLSQALKWVGALPFDRSRRCMQTCMEVYTFLKIKFSAEHNIFLGLDVASFADRLWGNIYFDQEARKFSRKSPQADSPRSFVYFVLEPLYKLYTQVLFAYTPVKKLLKGHWFYDRS
jgi:hypothetical protein